MKRAFISRTMLAACMGLLFCVAAWSYNVNDRVQVEWKGGWYPARVLKVEGDKYLIHYDGYQAAYDEWVTAARMKALSVPEYKVGDSIKVNWKGSWYPATILKANDGRYLIHYTGYESSWDEWVGPNRIKR
jgi:hypothetical protein